MNIRFIFVLLLLSVLNFSVQNYADELPDKNLLRKQNILFIAIDDLRDWTGYSAGHPQVKTPSLDRLAASGAAFTRSYCASACCNPSRTALLTGLRPSETGVYLNSDDWRIIVSPNVVTLQEHFQQNGYKTLGAGKIYHGSYPAKTGWDDYLIQNRKLFTNNVTSTKRNKEGDNDQYLDGVGGIKFQPLDVTDEQMEDYHIVQYGIDELNKKHDKPFFLAVGLHKPHMPWNVPKKYYDLYPPDNIVLPEVFEDDLNDLPPEGIKFAKPDGDHAAILKSGRWKYAVQGYLAAITFCDTQIGRLLDAFEKSPYSNNTIVVLWSDHGWHHGEKSHWRKFAMWEEANRAPLIWRVPGLTQAGTKIETPIDLTHIYPTLCDLTGISKPKQELSGKSIRPLLEGNTGGNTNGNADGNINKTEPAAVMTYGYKNHAVRTEQWRYIRYENGGEELYDESRDPLEWTNLAAQQEFTKIKTDLAQFLPQTNKPPQPKPTPTENKPNLKKKQK
ncbi:MAG: sulfatase [Planctomycetaceae bacterium]|jgi:arylsulfatase A-like enzyme|nr:sulfatase [Planctomycetaceae bacterium]